MQKLLYFNLNKTFLKKGIFKLSHLTFVGSGASSTKILCNLLFLTLYFLKSGYLHIEVQKNQSLSSFLTKSKS